MFNLTDNDCYDGAKKLGSISFEIFDKNGTHIGSFKRRIITNRQGSVIATIRGNGVYDQHGKRTTTVTDVRKLFGSLSENFLVALWLLLAKNEE